jgi:hypothetical protein
MILHWERTQPRLIDSSINLNLRKRNSESGEHRRESRFTSATNPEDLKAWVLGFPGEHWQSHKLVAKLPETLADSDAQVAI